MRLAIEQGGVVVNVTKAPDGWTGKAGEWQPPAGTTARATDVAGPGWTWDGTDFAPPADPAPQPPPPPSRLERLEAALIAKGVVTRAEIEGAPAARAEA